MAKSKKGKKVSAKAIIKKAPPIEPTLLPARKNLSYTANMDNIIIEATFKKGSEKDADDNYVAPHLREVKNYIVIGKGELVQNKQIKKGVAIVPESIGKITVFEIDEKGYVGTIKPHYILAVINKSL